jgi:large subunit ribosomal protein L9
MEVLLIKDVPKVGEAGDAVRVSDGYARNYLFLRKLAVPMDEGARKQAQSLREARQNREQKVTAEVTSLAKQLDGTNLTFKARAGEQGKLYGSITAGDVAEELQRQTGVEVDKRKFELKDPIRELGEHQIEIRLAPRATAKITVVVEDAG